MAWFVMFYEREVVSRNKLKCIRRKRKKGSIFCLVPKNIKLLKVKINATPVLVSREGQVEVNYMF